MEKNYRWAEAAAFYNSRYEQHGRSIETVGWRSPDLQEFRFEVLLRGFELRSSSFLDVGCGLGDFVTFLDRRIGSDYRYVGVDVADRLIEDAQQRLGTGHRQFLHGDIFSLPLVTADYVICSGGLSLRVEGAREYAHSSLKRMFELANKAVSVNFLSKRVDYELPKNQHFAPEEVLGWALDISPSVTLFHDYKMREFTVQLHHPHRQ